MVVLLAETLRLTFGDGQVSPEFVTLRGPAAEAEPSAREPDARPDPSQTPCWQVDAAGLLEDVLTERRVLVYRKELGKEWGRHRPADIHRIRVEPFGDPPSDKSRFWDLFKWLDEETRAQFQVPIDELKVRFAGTTKRELSKTALHQRGWWSNPRPDKDHRFPNGVGSQVQRIAWRAAGYETTQVLVEPNPCATGSADKLRVGSVTFRAIPGRLLWHPFRHELRAGRADPLGAGESVRQRLSHAGVEEMYWFDVVLASALLG